MKKTLNFINISTFLLGMLLLSPSNSLAFKVICLDCAAQVLVPVVSQEKVTQNSSVDVPIVNETTPIPVIYNATPQPTEDNPTPVQTYENDQMEVVPAPLVHTIAPILTISFDTSLKYGDTGIEVENLQKFLKEINYYHANIDGKFGLQTREAVKGFQKNQDLVADGYFGILSRIKANIVLQDIITNSTFSRD